MKRLAIFLAIAAAFVFSWRLLDEIPLLVIGQPSSTGLMQQNKETSFFNTLRAMTGLPLRVTYKPLEAVGFKDTHQLQMLKDGLFDLVSLRFLQNSEAEPGLQGIDLVGLNSDYATADHVIRDYRATLERYLRERFAVKLLGLWTFGPQEFFCRQPLTRLEDIKGLRIRVGSPSLATFISELGGKPAIIPFDDTKYALAIGLVDCAITSAASANHAGWPEDAGYYFPLAVHFGLNGYVISLRKWNALSRREQAVLQAAFDDYTADLWQYAQDIQHDAVRCNTGRECKFGKPFRMVLAEPAAHDVQLLREITARVVLPEWGARCDRVHPGCMGEWQAKLAGHLSPRHDDPQP